MNILKTVKEFLFKESEFRIEDVDDYLKCNYYLETLDLVWKSRKLSDSEKCKLVNKLTYNCTHDYFIDKNGYEYFKRKLG